MKIKETYEGGPELNRAVFQVESIDVNLLEKMIGQKYHDLYWLMDDVFCDEKFKKEVKWPNGLGYTIRLIKKPVEVVESFYDENVISEDQIIEFFKTLGIEMKKEIDANVLEKIIEKDNRDKAYRDAVIGKNEIISKKTTSEEIKFGRKFIETMHEINIDENSDKEKEKE